MKMFVRTAIQPGTAVPMSGGNACFPFWEVFHVVDLEVGGHTVHITLPNPTVGLRCSSYLLVNEYCRRRIRDLPMLGKAVLLQVTLRRMSRPRLGMEAMAMPA